MSYYNRAKAATGFIHTQSYATPQDKTNLGEAGSGSTSSTPQYLIHSKSFAFQRRSISFYKCRVRTWAALFVLKREQAWSKMSSEGTRLNLWAVSPARVFLPMSGPPVPKNNNLIYRKETSAESLIYSVCRINELIYTRVLLIWLYLFLTTQPFILMGRNC